MLKITIFLLSFSMLAQEMKISGAQIPNFDEKGKLTSLIKCSSAVQKNGKVYMSGVTLTLNNESKTQIKSSKCQFLEHEKLIRGKEKIFLKSKDMDLQGKGFVYDQEKKTLVIHNDVIIYLDNNKGAIK